MSDRIRELREALETNTVLNIEAVIYDKNPLLVQPYLDTVSAARRELAREESLQDGSAYQRALAAQRMWDNMIVDGDPAADGVGELEVMEFAVDAALKVEP